MCKLIRLFQKYNRQNAVDNGGMEAWSEWPLKIVSIGYYVCLHYTIFLE